MHLDTAIIGALVLATMFSTITALAEFEILNQSRTGNYRLVPLFKALRKLEHIVPVMLLVAALGLSAHDAAAGLVATVLGIPFVLLTQSMKISDEGPLRILWDNSVYLLTFVANICVVALYLNQRWDFWIHPAVAVSLLAACVFATHVRTETRIRRDLMSLFG